MSVIGEVMISSPGSGSSAATAVCTAAVPEAHAQACLTPRSRRIAVRAASERALRAGQGAAPDRFGGQRDLLVSERSAEASWSEAA